jgi:choline dehydrogenase-like flavoprotein
MTLQQHGGTARKAHGLSRAESVDVVVVGAGQAGLSLSHELSRADVEHVVLERGRVGQAWRTRWESFCLVIPNWTVQLPGPLGRLVANPQASGRRGGHDLNYRTLQAMEVNLVGHL